MKHESRLTIWISPCFIHRHPRLISAYNLIIRNSGTHIRHITLSQPHLITNSNNLGLSHSFTLCTTGTDHVPLSLNLLLFLSLHSALQVTPDLIPRPFVAVSSLSKYYIRALEFAQARPTVVERALTFYVPPLDICWTSME